MGLMPVNAKDAPLKITLKAISLKTRDEVPPLIPNISVTAKAVAKGAVIELLKPAAKKPMPNMVFESEPNSGSNCVAISPAPDMFKPLPKMLAAAVEAINIVIKPPSPMAVAVSARACFKSLIDVHLAFTAEACKNRL